MNNKKTFKIKYTRLQATINSLNTQIYNTLRGMRITNDTRTRQILEWLQEQNIIEIRERKEVLTRNHKRIKGSISHIINLKGLTDINVGKCYRLTKKGDILKRLMNVLEETNNIKHNRNVIETFINNKELRIIGG